MAQLINITSEALQATIRRLLPSQQGFGEDLQATNVVTPIIDLTPTAEGSVLPTQLQQAIAHGSQTTFDSQNNTVNLAATPGFWRVTGTVSGATSGSVGIDAKFKIDDGSSAKVVWRLNVPFSSSAGDDPISDVVDLIFYLNAGDTLQITTNGRASANGSYRQVATVTGDLVNPSGFVFQ